MFYNFKEYEPIFDTPQKRKQEIVISRTIMDLLNKNKYQSIDDFLLKNNNYQNFLKNNNRDVVIKHFGNTITEEDFIQIINNLYKLTKKKQDFEKDNIKTTNIDGKEYVTFNGKDSTYHLDNSVSDKSFQENLKDTQSTSQDYQTSDIKHNTENMVKELSNRKNQNIAFVFLNDINVNELNIEERNLFVAASEYQKNSGHIIRIDLSRNLIIDENDNMKKIDKENGIYFVKDENNNKEIEKSTNYQKQLTKHTSANTIYGN